MKSTLSNFAWMSALLVVSLTTSSCSSGSPNSATAKLNSSALYAPPTVTLLPRVPYQFKEGILTLDQPQRYHSDYSYRLAGIVGGNDYMTYRPITPAK